MAPRASVVMPVHNSGRFIAAAIGSLLASTLRDFELLVIDDASTDDSMAAARRASADDPRVRIIPVERGGVAAARNAGLHAATGEYIANLNVVELQDFGSACLVKAYCCCHFHLH